MSDVSAQSPSRSRLAGVLLAAPFLVMGGFITGIGLEWVPYDPAKVHAPGWVIAVCGLMFVCGGLATLRATWNQDPRPQPIFGVAVLLGLTLVCNWVAFGEGERRFTSTTSINDTVVDSRPVEEGTGRFVFGIGAVILDFVLIALVINYLRKRSE
jgi:hypothetical protein